MVVRYGRKSVQPISTWPRPFTVVALIGASLSLAYLSFASVDYALNQWSIPKNNKPISPGQENQTEVEIDKTAPVADASKQNSVTQSFTEKEKQCGVLSAQNLPRVAGMVISGTRIEPAISPGVLEEGVNTRGSTFLIVEIDTKTAGIDVTYSFICLSDANGAMVEFRGIVP